jgi:hypothetical protein
MSEDEIKELMEEYDLEEDEAERVKEIMDEWEIDAEEAMELVDEI